MKPREALKRQDSEFAGRMARRDESVLRDIQQAYERSLRRLLERWLGPAINGHDVDDILSQALAETWTDYREGQGASVRCFYFVVGKRRLQDRLKQNHSRQRREETAALRISATRGSASASADESILDREGRATAAGAAGATSKLVDDVVATLTPRQKLAFLRRFGSDGSSKWAKHLQIETGVPAKQWRKASGQALSKVRDSLINHGVYYSKEGGRYEVA